MTDVVSTSPTTAAARYDVAEADCPNQFPVTLGDDPSLAGRFCSPR